MSVVALITARENSQRLKCKALLDINCKPMLQRVYERVKLSQVDKVVIATSVNSPNIIALCGLRSIPYYAGMEDDILDRLYNAANKFKASIVVRIWGDSPLVSPDVIDECVEYFRKFDVDYVATEGFPKGTAVGVLSFTLLENLHKNLKEPKDREWLTKYILESQKYRIGYVKYKGDLPCMDISVDDESGLNFARRVFERYGDKFTLDEVLCMK